jgi:FkbM family methyltransferase
MKNVIVADLRASGYRRYLAKRIFAVLCHRINRRFERGLCPKKTVNGVTLLFQLQDYTQCLFYFDTSLEPENNALIGAIGRAAGGDLIDVGANYGQFTYELQGSFRQSLLFEPNPVAARFLRALFSGSANIEIMEAGAAESERTAFLVFPDEQQSGVATVKSVGEGPEIKLTTIDNIVTRRQLNPSLIKLDCEGFEESVLRGAKQTIRERTPILAWEVDSKAHFESVKSLLDPTWNFYRIDAAVKHGLKGLTKFDTVARCLLTSSKVRVCRVDEISGPISLVFAVPPTKERIFNTSLAELARNGVRY